jgi:hypothetical protein
MIDEPRDLTVGQLRALLDEQDSASRVWIAAGESLIAPSLPERQPPGRFVLCVNLVGLDETD